MPHRTLDALALDWRLTVLPNGLRLITVARPGTPVVAARAYVRAGSRYDSEHQSSDDASPPWGLAHLVEHLLFRGTQRHSQHELFAAVERLGGTLDAGTSREYLTVSAVVPTHALDTALRAVAELCALPALREEDFWAEKLVVLEEIRQAQAREEALLDQFIQNLWRVHPLRTPVRGTLATLQALDYPSALAFFRHRFVSGNMLLAVCGDIAHADVANLAADRFQILASGPQRLPGPLYEPALAERRTAHLTRDLGQVHLLMGVPTVGMKHPDKSALKIVERVWSMGGSGRLYQRLRVHPPLVYSIRALSVHHEDAGYLAIHTSCSPRNVDRVREAILAEWGALRRHGVSQDELQAAKGNYAGTLARCFETNRALAGILGVEGLLHRVEPLDEAARRIGAVGLDDVVRAARTYLDLDRHVSVSMGREVMA